MKTPRVRIPARRYSGYIFDLDGTLVDSMAVHFRAWRWALARYGAPPAAFLWPEFVAHGGMAATDIVADLNQIYGLQMDPQIVAQRKRARYDYLVESEHLPVIAETVELVRRLQAEGIPYAIGTGSAMPGALATLNAAGIRELFEVIVTPEDVPQGKPAPDIFLECAHRMGVEPCSCVVFEDADPGVQAARAAGMDCVRVGAAEPVDVRGEVVGGLGV